MEKEAVIEDIEKVCLSKHPAANRMEYQRSKGYRPPDTQHCPLQTKNRQRRLSPFKTGSGRICEDGRLP